MWGGGEKPEPYWEEPGCQSPQIPRFAAPFCPLCPREGWQRGACTGDGDSLGTALSLVASEHPWLSHRPPIAPYSRQVLASGAAGRWGYV